MVLFQTYHNFVLLHASLRQPLPICRSHQRRLGQGVAAVDAGDGGGVDGSRVVAQRGAPLPGAAMAASSNAVMR